MMKKIVYLILSLFIISCQNQTFQESTNIQLFELVPPEISGIDFNNFIVENTTINYFTFMQLYMGAGVAAGDINNDGLPDLYFSSNFGFNKLYLNKGNLQFEDITEKAGVGISEGFRTGTTMADVNGDGYLDIYVCRSGWYKDDFIKRNLLYINNGDETFTESAQAYGLDDPRNSVHSSFFDYDKDGDLDMFLINTTTDFTFTRRMAKMDFIHNEPTFKNLNSNDRLYRNNGDGTFSDVSEAAGILPDIAFGLSVLTVDLNQDGWTDIFIGNDFITPDYLYINQGDGTFVEKSKEYFKHTSFYSMGADAADINNDGQTDLFVLDMMPQDYKKSKTSMSMVDPVAFQQAVDWGYNYQYKHNVLQLNNGMGSFSEISQLAGVAQSDWSWASNFADLDNDGYQDLFITNGIKKYVTDMDFQERLKKRVFNTSPYEIAHLLPSGEMSNYVYRNNGDLTFSDLSQTWGLDTLSLSNGCIIADLDLDGDLDIITNNADAPAFLYENKSEQTGNRFLRLQLAGTPEVHALNAKVYLKDENGVLLQFREVLTSRGYLSCSEEMVHFGTGELDHIPLLEVKWANGRISKLENVKTNRVYTIKYGEEGELDEVSPNPTLPLFREVTTEKIIPPFRHVENDFNDYEKQVLLPHRQSTNGPALAVADVNGDGMEDFYVGGAHQQAGALYLQNKGGAFEKSRIAIFGKDAGFEDVDALFFDADGDGDQDLYVVSGGSEFGPYGEKYQDRLYLNNQGVFVLAKNALPAIEASGGSVAASDFDLDGDLDLFVGGRVLPDQYPYPPQSYLLKNENGIFSNVTTEEIQAIGMVTDAIWTDVDGNGAPDLMVVGEWMRIEVFLNFNGALQQATDAYGLEHTQGWWNTIAAHDIDGDGDQDFVAGNLGLNYKFHASPNVPLKVHCKDFDENGTYDIVLAKQVQATYYPVRGRTCSSVQMPFIEEKYPTFNAFADADIQEIYGEDQLTDALTYEAQLFESVYLLNQGSHFEIVHLPVEAQIFPVRDIVFSDLDKDGHTDIILAGNKFDAEVETTRADAGKGLVIKGKGNGKFQPLSLTESGFYAPNDVRNLAKIKLINGSGILVTNNNEGMQLFVNRILNL